MISNAIAQTAAPAAQAAPDFFSLGNPLLMIVVMIVFMYLLVIRPQQKRAKEHAALLGALASGDEVVTQAGILGKVTNVGESFIKVEVAGGVEITIQKQAVASVLPKGTLKNS